MPAKMKLTAAPISAVVLPAACGAARTLFRRPGLRRTRFSHAARLSSGRHVARIAGMSLCLVAAVLLSADVAAAAVSFQDKTAQIVPGLIPYPVSWGDFDNDGYVDIYDGAHVWRNNGGTNFTSFASVSGVGNWADYDNAGFLDIDHVVSDVFQGDCWIAGVTDGRELEWFVSAPGKGKTLCELRVFGGTGGNATAAVAKPK